MHVLQTFLSLRSSQMHMEACLCKASTIFFTHCVHLLCK